MAEPPPASRRPIFLGEENLAELRRASPLLTAPRARGSWSGSLDDSLPAIQSSRFGPTAPGALFLSDIRFDDNAYRSHLMVVADDGSPIGSRLLAAGGYDFKVQPNGRLSYFDGAAAAYYITNAKFGILDSVRCRNGYVTDLHDLQLLPNGHALVMAYDPQIVDMSILVAGGNPAAEVMGARTPRNRP